MFKSIFGKQFAAVTAVLTVSLLILSIILTGFYRAHIIGEKSKMLADIAKRITEIYARRYAANMDEFFVDPITRMGIENELQAVQEYLDVSCFFTDSKFRVTHATTNILERVEGKEFDPGEFPEVLGGGVKTVVGSMSGLLAEDSLTVCYPVIIRAGAGAEVKALVFVCASMAELNANVTRIAGVTLWCIAGTALASFIVMYFTLKTITRPVKAVSEAAKIIAAGNFENRIDQKSRDEMGQLAKSFNEMADSLENQEKARRDFISNISHDLRSPLTSMRGFIEAILDGTVPPENQARYLNVVLEEFERLTKLTNDVIDISKAQGFDSRLNLSRFDINELIRKTIIMFESKITAKGLDVSAVFAAEQSPVTADYEKIQRVLYNLIDNAVKFTSGGGKITVETAESDGKILVSVEDDGRGISPEEQKKVFDRFYKADASRGEDKTGSGLGLAIVREFVKAHGENAAVSTPANGKGARFEFSLRLAE